MNKQKEESKTWRFIEKIWKNTVWSKLISTGLIVLIGAIWTNYSSYSLNDIYNYFINVLTYKIPAFAFLSIIGIYFIVKFLIKLFRKKTDPIWDEQCGNYKFRELYEILSNQNYEVGTKEMELSGHKAPTADLLMMFYHYSPVFNKGLNMRQDTGDGGYLYGILAPKLVGYGLVNKLESKNLEIDFMDIKYETSEVGHKFFGLIEKSIYLKNGTDKNQPRPEAAW